MIEKESYERERLLKKIEELKYQLLEANNVIDAIKDGSVDALVLNQDGTPQIYSLESADYTYRILIEKFREGALSISETGLILYCNEAFSKLIGRPANKIIGTFLNSYVDSVGQFEDIKNGMKTGQGKGEIILNIDGVKLPIYISLSDLQPQLPAIGIIVTDLTEKRKHQAAIELYQRQLELKVSELNQTNTSLEQFVHVISHDIKEPIRKILTYSSYLDSPTKDLSDQKKSNALRIITSSTQRLNSLVNDLVKYAYSTQKMEFTEVDLNIILNEVVEDLEFLIMENEVSIKFNNLPIIYGSAIQMRQLFSNLLTNSIKYKKKTELPKITISSEITDCVDMRFPNRKFYKLSVKDNGIGIDNEHLSKIFAIFQRLNTSAEYSGNGIGLAICKRIMENHSGKIEAESSRNDGSTFIMYFAV